MQLVLRTQDHPDQSISSVSYFFLQYNLCNQGFLSIGFQIYWELYKKVKTELDIIRKIL